MKKRFLFAAIFWAGIASTLPAQKVSVNAKQTKLENVFNTISKQTGYTFAYSTSIINPEIRVTIHSENENLKDVLQKLFKDEDINFEIKDKKVYLKAKESTTPVKTGKNKTIKGNVTDQTGEAVIGANVVVPGTTIGTITDFDGNFVLDVPEDAKLKFSYIGLLDQLVDVKGKNQFNIQMKDNSKALEEVVVVGYGTQKKVNLTGAVSSVSIDKLESRPTSDLSQSLQGMVPGLNLSVNNAGGALGNSLSANIRGTGTIGQGSTSSPLILIDGVPGDMNAINPNDVETISVLKDAAASSIYGSRAPFGVILITTKAGKAGKTQVSYNNSFRWNNVMNLPDLMDSYTFANFFNTAAANSGQSPVFDDETIDRILKYQNGEITTSTIPNPSNGMFEWHQKANDNVNWPKKHYKTGFAQQHNISVTGGNDKLSFFSSFAYLNQDGNLRFGDDNFKRYNASLKASCQINDYFKLGANMRLIREDLDRPTFQDAGGLYFHEISRLWPMMPFKDPNGNYLRHSKLIQISQGGRQNNTKNTYYTQANARITPLKGWTINGDVTYKFINSNLDTHLAKIYEWTANNDPVLVSWGGSNAAGSSYMENTRSNYHSLTSNIYTDYNYNNTNHDITLLVGFNSETYKSDYIYAKRDDIITDEVPSINTSMGKDYTKGSIAEYSTLGFFSRLNYIYKDKILAEFNIRYDGSSRFLDDKRWKLFPSLSLGYNLARENFWEPYQQYVSTLKPRFSWGILGNQNTSSYYPFYSTQPLNLKGGNWLIDGEKPTTATAPLMVSSTLTWEKVITTNIGIDIAALKNRLNISGEWFKRKTKDMVGPPKEVSSIIGISNGNLPRVNNADMETKGWELSITWNDRISSVAYDISFTLSDYKSKITRYPNPTNSLSTYFDGYVMGNIWGFETVGIAKTNEEMQEHLSNNNQNQLGSSWGAGDIMYKDLDGDGIVSLQGKNTLDQPGDRRIIGNSTPRYQFGINLGANWKGFDIRAFLQGVGKRDLWLSGNYFFGSVGSLWQSVGYTEHLDFYRPADHTLGENLDSYFPKPYFNQAQSDKNQRPQSRYLQNGAYLRLKNIQLGYSLPKSLISRIKLNQCRLFISGENLFTMSSIFGTFDPETTSGDMGSGKTYPLSKTFALGASISF